MNVGNTAYSKLTEYETWLCLFKRLAFKILNGELKKLLTSEGQSRSNFFDATLGPEEGYIKK